MANPADGGIGTVMLVEDHDLLSQAVAVALRAEGFEPVVVHPSGDLHITAEVARHTPDLVLLDLDLGPRTSPGERLVGTILQHDAAVLVVTGVEEPARISAALDSGAVGFVHKTRGIDALLEAIGRMARGLPPNEPDAIQRLRAQVAQQRDERDERLKDFDRLSDREQQVLAQLMRGESVHAIAAANVVSEATVRTQVRAVLTKLGVNSQLAAVALANNAGWRQDSGDS